jgi:hypothetical protein
MDHLKHGLGALNDDLWLFGVLSGFNIYAPQSAKEPKPIFFRYEERSLALSVTEQCKRSPEKSVIEIVVAFTDDLRRSMAKMAARAIPPKLRLEFHIAPTELPELRDTLKAFAEHEKLTFSLPLPPTPGRAFFFASMVRPNEISIEIANLTLPSEYQERGAGQINRPRQLAR